MKSYANPERSLFQKKDIKTNTNSKGCHLVISHKLNQYGYFRKKIGDKSMMYHRYVYELSHGPIPEGFEVDHKCRERNCINVEHLQALSNLDHTIKTNKERYSERKLKAYDYWYTNQCTGIHLSEIFKVSFSSACGWIREWKKERAETIARAST